VTGSSSFSNAGGLIGADGAVGVADPPTVDVADGSFVMAGGAREDGTWGELNAGVSSMLSDAGRGGDADSAGEGD
jgi:hypothetical protein